VRVVLALAAIAAALPGLAADETPPAPAPTRATVVAAPRYRAGPFHKFMLGPTYRRPWTTPFQIDVLDLGTFAGGLRPVRRGGGKETRSLRFESPDGREWRVRSVDKNPAAALPRELRDTFVEQLAQDQISAANPAGAVIVDGLTEAAGVLGVPHRLVVIPDDPRLGEFHADFAGMVGTLEEIPRVKAPATPGFEGFDDKLDMLELWERLDEHPEETVDERAFLKARLLDLVIGDFDRHDDQWDWVRRRDGRQWEPVPKDRDEAFAKFDGFVVALARPSQPQLVDFQEHYPKMVGLTWQSRFLDRRHLSSLEWREWREVAAELQSSLTDPVIDEAVRRMPPEYERIVGKQMAAKLKGRRDRLPAAARELYEILARDAEIHGTDKADEVAIRPGEDGRVEITLAAADDPGEPWFRRRYDPRETDEVRVYLKGGDDRVVREAGTERLLVRVIGGDGNDVLDDSQGGHSHFYDSVGENRVIEGPGTHDSDRPYVRPVDGGGNPTRDWGHQTLKFPWLAAGGDLGLFAGAQVQRTGYGFRKDPYQSRQTLRAGYSTGLKGVRAEYEGEFLRTHSNRRWIFLARYSDADLLRFYGFGNETSEAGGDEFHHVSTRSYSLAPSFRVGGDGVYLLLGPVARFMSTPVPPDRFIGVTHPYGTGDFGEVGAQATIVLDGRNRDRASTRGGRLEVGGTYTPSVWSVKEAFGEVHGQAMTYLSPHLALDPTLALRVGGKQVWGTYPFQDAAYIGGLEAVRGLRPLRYAGDASAWANAELRLALFRYRALVPARFGIFGLADAGRVWLAGEDSQKIHTGLGGGIWTAFLKPENTLSAAAARSEGHVRVYVRFGFMF